MGALQQANGIYLGILESQSNIFKPLFFLQRILTAPIRSLKARDEHPLANERNWFWNSRIAIKNFQALFFFLQRILTAPMRSLMVGAGQPLAHERNLFWNSRIVIKNFPTRDFLEIEFHCAQARSLKCRSGHDP